MTSSTMPVRPSRRWYQKHDRWRTVGIYLAFTLMSIWVLAPLWFAVHSSFSNPIEMAQRPPNWIPANPTLDNYIAVFTSATDESGQYTSEQDGRMLTALFWSFLIGGIVALSNVIIGGLAGYAYSRHRFPGSRSGYIFLLASRVVPGIAIILPFFFLFRIAGLIDSPWALIISYNLFTLPLAIWLLKSYFDTLPIEIEEAAFVDGASRLRTIWVIVRPIARPGLVATGLLIFLESWSEFFYALVLTNQLTVPPLLAGYTNLQTFTPNTLMAATVISLIPPILLAVVFQRYIVSGLSTGAVK